jgi:hypothetical protein
MAPLGTPTAGVVPPGAAAQESAVTASPQDRSSKASRPELRPVSSEEWSLRVTLDAAGKAELDQLVCLLSHKTRGDLAAVLREAIRCGIEKHGKRKGAVAPARTRKASPAGATPARMDAGGPVTDASTDDASAGSAPRDGVAATAAATGSAGTASDGGAPNAVAAGPSPRPRRAAIPADVKRAVWERDGGRCAWVSSDGKRCGSTWMLEFDHIRPVALGGTSTVDDVRVACKAHNFYAAELIFGREFMVQFLRRPAANAAPSGDESGDGPTEDEAAAAENSARARGLLFLGKRTRREMG